MFTTQNCAQWIRQYLSSKFIKNLSVLMAGTGIATVISFLSSPLLSRLYTPEAFGDLSLYMAAVSICATFLTLRYEPAIMLPKSENDSVSLTVLASTISVVFGIILYIAVLLCGSERVFAIFGAQSSTQLLPFVISSAISMAIFQSISIYLNKVQKYRLLSISKILSASTKLLFAIAASLYFTDGLIISSTASSIILCIIFLAIFAKLTKKNIDIKSIPRVAREYKDFPKLNIVSDTLNTLTANMHILLFFTFFGSETSGNIAFASKLLIVPLGIISTSFSQIFYQRISSTDCIDSIKRIYIKSMAGTGAIAASLIIVVTITPQQIIPMIFGDSWANLHSFLIPMTWWIGFHFFGSSLSTIYIKLRKLGYIFAFNIFNALFTFLSIYISAKLDKDAIFATTIFSIGRAFLYGTLALGGLKMIQSYKSKQLAI